MVPPPNIQGRQAHVGFHPQKQQDLVWAGVVLPVGKMTVVQMRGLAAIAHELGDGDIRLTVWQNLLISGIKAADTALIESRLRALGLTANASSVRAGLVACTGAPSCKFANANTKDTALEIASWVESRVALDTPVNIHLTGCPHSCAQHYIGDIGMIAARIPVAPDSDDTVEGFHILVGGGFGPDAAIARELVRDVRREDCPALVERIFNAYLANRTDAEPFVAFARRHDISALKALVEEAGAAA